MAARIVSPLKFVGTISLGLLTGFSYTLSTLTLPTLLTLPTAGSAALAFSHLTTLSVTHVRSLATLSSSVFLLAYLLSERTQKHPYLLWTTLFVGASFFTELIPTARPASRKSKGKGKAPRRMDASYEVLGQSDHSEEEIEAEVVEDDINGEEVRLHMESFMTAQLARTTLSAIAFTMSVVGIWGDGASNVVFLER